MATVAITGAGGFVGRAVCMRLATAGMSVRAVVRGRPAPPHAGADVTELRVSDLREVDVQHTVCDGVDAVVHLAARVHRFDDATATSERAYQAENVDLTAQLARAAAKCGVRRFVFLSSIKAVGETSGATPLGPAAAPSPSDPYGRSKLAAERQLATIAAESGLEFVIIRPPLVYGPEVGANFRRIVEWVARGLPLPLGSLQNRRSFVSVWNLADLIARTVGHPGAAGQILHVADERAVSTQELIRLIASGLGRSPRLLPFPPALLAAGLAALGQRQIAERLIGTLEVDFSRTRELLDWSPPLGIEQGVVRAVREMRL